jgi:hypothetical protein
VIAFSPVQLIHVAVANFCKFLIFK